MTRQYDPADWYWVVGGSTTEVYSSASHSFVPVGDAAYIVWLSEYLTYPTKVADAAEVGRILAQYNIRPTVPAVLAGYLDAKLSDVVANPLYKVLLDVYVELLHPTPNETQVRERIRSKF